MYWLELETAGEFDRSLKRNFPNVGKIGQAVESGTKKLRRRTDAEPNVC